VYALPACDAAALDAQAGIQKRALLVSSLTAVLALGPACELKTVNQLPYYILKFQM